MKYVMTTLGPTLFPDVIPHAALKSVVDAMPGGRILSAGFLEISRKHIESVSVSGESESLCMKPSSGDARLLESVIAGYTSLLNFHIAEHSSQE